jgi:hypothetical protein
VELRDACREGSVPAAGTHPAAYEEGLIMWRRSGGAPKTDRRANCGVFAVAIMASMFLSGTGAIAATSAGSSAPQLPKPPANGEMAFVISNLLPAVYPGKDACPNGTANMVRDNFLSTVSPAERARLLKPENEPELTAKWKAYGFSADHRMNVCANYDKFDHPLYKTVQSKIAYGLDLDNDASGKPNDPYVCPHQNFVGPTGEKGVDNQAYRALGCERNERAADGGVGGDVSGYRSFLMSDYTIVMILRNVHSLVNDDNVEVIFASSPNQPITDSQQNFIHDASYQVTTNPRWRNVLHGHIHNGVLQTDTHDIVLTRPIGLGGSRGLHQEWDFARGRVEFTFKPDGTLDGVIDGYAPLTMMMQYEIYGGAGTVTVADDDCASKYRTLKAMADGERDPKTGQCNRISTVLKLEAVPAFVFDQPAGTKTAAK